ncbi:transcription cofactor vestigial-like protein 4 isoform X2 [Hyla sarda]|uniref:transcription cofactor vestigial-like protein 4 isoform X2 n=1 Tax=Hyla sarda TaxID=327740 RepID=UPI0024C252C9|nr:transcription cofactor vestigial-like protein 4 isoform X2 [Hyla sarda]
MRSKYKTSPVQLQVELSVILQLFSAVTMAVSSLQYTMGISSGFKVYILEGQHSARNVDRYRPLTNHGINHGIPIYPIKRKLSPDPPQPHKRLCSSSQQNRNKSSHSPMNMKCATRQTPTSEPPSPKVFPSHVDLQNVLKRLMPERRLLERKETRQTEEEQPLALVKRLEKPSEQPMVSSAMLQQMRPSVITCISRPKASPPPTTDNKTSTSPLWNSQTQRSPRTCSPDVEEHFQRSLKSCTSHPSARSPPSPYSSVEDHFSKALGSRWLLIRAAADSPSSQENPTRR